MSAATKAIHAGCRQLGIDEDGRRAIYLRVVGKESQCNMTEAEKERVVQELRKLGFHPKVGARKPTDTLLGKNANVIRAFWLSGYNLGVFESNDDRAIIKFAKRQVASIENPRFFDKKATDAVIEAIKAIVRRETKQPGLWRSDVRRELWRSDPAVQVVFAQWEVLAALGAAPAATIYDWSGNPGRTFPFENRDRAILVEMQKKLGELIRAAKKVGA